MEVYKITNLINNKCYIGITGNTFRKRYNHRDDWWNAPKVSELVKNAVNKYGSLIKEYESIKSVELDGFDPPSVSRCCKGSLKSHKNLIWKRV